jgi:hypothetical protein
MGDFNKNIQDKTYVIFFTFHFVSKNIILSDVLLRTLEEIFRHFGEPAASIFTVQQWKLFVLCYLATSVIFVRLHRVIFQLRDINLSTVVIVPAGTLRLP